MVVRRRRPPLPHTITIDTKAARSIAGFRYLPRSGSGNGRVGSFEIRVSDDAASWRCRVASGTWPDTTTEKTVNFAAVSARYVRLTATTEAGSQPVDQRRRDQPAQRANGICTDCAAADRVDRFGQR